jgi:hypothetical protein
MTSIQELVSREDIIAALLDGVRELNKEHPAAYKYRKAALLSLRNGDTTDAQVYASLAHAAELGELHREIHLLSIVVEAR